MKPTYIITQNDWLARTNGTENQAVEKALQAVHSATSIYDRFDELINLIDQCEIYKKANENAKQAQELQDHAIAFASAIVNAKDFAELKDKVIKRRKYKKIDPKYMPWPVPSNKLDITKFTDRKSYVKAAALHNLKMYGQKRYREVNLPNQKSDRQKNAKYLTESEREAYRIFVSEGTFKKISRDTNGHLVLEHFDTEQYNAHGYDDNAIFVISPTGEMFAGSTVAYHFYHSSFLAGKPVFFAGTIVVTDGELQFLDDWSGHYSSLDFRNEIQVISFFRKLNLLAEIQNFNLFNKFNEANTNAEGFIENRINSLDKVNKQLIDRLAYKFINKFSKDVDKELYIKNAKTRINIKQAAAEVYNELRQTYLEIALPILDQSLIKYLDSINDMHAKQIIQNNLRRLAESFIESSIRLNITVDQISSVLSSSLETIRTNAEFIRKQALKCDYTDTDAGIFVASFIEQVLNSLISGPKTTKTLLDAIFAQKLAMVTELHLLAYRSKGESITDNLLSEFRNIVYHLVEQSNSKTRANFSDDELISSAIGHAKYFIEIKIKLVRSLFTEIDKVRSYAKQEDCCVENEINQLILIIDKKIDEFDKSTSLKFLQDESSKLQQLIAEKKVYLEAKNSLLKMIWDEMNYITKTSNDYCICNQLLTELKKAGDLNAVKSIAVKMSLTSAVIKKRGALGALSLFDNPIKIKLDNFMIECSNKQQLLIRKYPS